MGTIGFGGRASHVMPAFMREDDVQMVAACDVKGNRRKLARDTINRHYGNKDCDVYIDLRDLLARDDIDAVLIATGDYWHSAAACLTARAGKDMYCEKPMSVTITEGRALADTMKRYGRIFQCGTQPSCIRACWAN
jgi:predicted dehydrogenase